MSKEKNTQPIYFYNKGNDFYQFANLYDDGMPQNVNGIWYRTNEHFFQSQAFTQSPAVQRQIMQAKTGGDAFRIAQNHYKDPDWRNRADSIMLFGLIAKFSDPVKLHKLLSTGNALLVEDSDKDRFWGVGASGNGENKLGLMLMAVRDCYAQSIQTQTTVDFQNVWAQSNL